MRFGRIEQRLAAAIVLTALIPLLGAVYLANSVVRKTSDLFFVPEISARLDEALGLYQDLARAEKAAMRSEATAIAERPDLAKATRTGDHDALARILSAVIATHPDLVSVRVTHGDDTLGFANRGHPVDEAHELSLRVRRTVGSGEEADDDDASPALACVFAANKARFEGLDRMSEFVSAYEKMSARRSDDERAYLMAFAVLLGFTIVAAIGVGTLLARGVSTRVVRLAEATRKVGAGDLSTRVDEAGEDEVGDLARAFNRMLAEIETTRARIEYLQRIGAWQEMARRLAHEIKNPLTPIQLAVQEVHQRYRDDDPEYRRLLDATLEVVEAEVATLRRLVGEFSDFARLPRARLESSDLHAFLEEQAAQPLFVEEQADAAAEKPMPRMTVSFKLPNEPAPVNMDKQMLRRALINLVRNSAQAIRDTGRREGHVVVNLGRAGDFWALDIDDDGPGIPADARERIFDPYVTSKHDGTGLGLAIVKKVIVEHGGVISASDGPLGGARLRMTIPAMGSTAAFAAIAAEAAKDQRRHGHRGSHD